MKLKDVIDSMDYHDLVGLHEDLIKGGLTTTKLVKDKIIQKEKEMGKYCHVCQSEIDTNSVHNYTILLGPEGLRRKASFCALDCLKYFITSIEKRKQELKESTNEKERSEES